MEQLKSCSIKKTNQFQRKLIRRQATGSDFQWAASWLMYPFIWKLVLYTWIQDKPVKSGILSGILIRSEDVMPGNLSPNLQHPLGCQDSWSYEKSDGDRWSQRPYGNQIELPWWRTPCVFCLIRHDIHNMQNMHCPVLSNFSEYTL